ESQTAGRQAVEMRRPDLAAVTAQIGVSEVIGEDHHDIGSPRRPRPDSRGNSPDCDGRQGDDQATRWHHRRPLRLLGLDGIPRELVLWGPAPSGDFWATLHRAGSYQRAIGAASTG